MQKYLPAGTPEWVMNILSDFGPFALAAVGIWFLVVAAIFVFAAVFIGRTFLQIGATRRRMDQMRARGWR